MFNPSPLYRISLGLTILLTIAAFITLLTSLGALIGGLGREPFLALLPWKPLLCIALAGINCSLRARLIVRRKTS
jgi:hypothetical protein